MPQTATGDPLLSIGEYTYGNATVMRWDDSTRVSIGRFCSIAGDVTIFAGGNHRPDWVTTYPLRIKLSLPRAWQDGVPATKGDIVIGSDVWIGQGVTILSGVQIGDGAVIGARAVVSKAVPPYAIVAGNPAKVVKMRFAKRQVDDLLRIRWWDWPVERILPYVDLLSSPDIDRFIREADRVAVIQQRPEPRLLV
jgi:acetyltransferase-like isoleucine patch superfamily enzyme